jgi:hypothetical protein
MAIQGGAAGCATVYYRACFERTFALPMPAPTFQQLIQTLNAYWAEQG